MEIKIVQASGNYSFYVNEQLVYRTEHVMLSFRYKVSVYAGNDSVPMFTIKQKSSMLSVSYEIIHADKTSSLLTVASATRHHFQCKTGNDNYDIYGHKSDKCSVYKNDIQVAWWDLRYSNDQKIIANNNCDLELLIFFYVLSMKLIQIKNDGQGVVERMVTNIAEEKPFDPDWRPQREPPPFK